MLRDKYECQQAGVQDLLKKVEQLTLDKTVLKDTAAKLVQNMTASHEELMKKLHDYEERMKREFENSICTRKLQYLFS